MKQRFSIFVKKQVTLKSFCTFILLFTLTLQSFYLSFMTVEYQLHLSDYIAQCINRDKPELHCDGQCVLMKKIGEKEKGDSSRNLVVYEYSAHYLHREYTVLTPTQPIEKFQKTYFSPNQTDYRFDYHTSIFRPPVV